MPLRKKKSQQSMGLMALAGETAKMARSMMVLDKTEAALEKEMEKEEKRAKPTTKIAKIRRKGEHLIHGKYLLLMVVILNVIDCLLVLGELMLDIKYVTDLLTKEYDRSDEFIGSMKDIYPGRLAYIGPEDIQALEHEILIATLTWDTNASHGHGDNHNISDTFSSTVTVQTVSSTTQNGLSRRRREYVGHDTAINSNQSYHGVSNGHHHEHSIEEEIAHGLHKASISILGILVCETIFKIFCFGKAMLEHKLECFDSFIVIASFIVDIVFIKGLQQFTVQEFVLILSFMVPWRIIRVVNSLVVAIMDHEHFRLVLLYKQKKKISQELKEAKGDNKGLQACIDALHKLCTDAGLPDTLVTAKLNMYRKVKAKSNALGAMSNFAVGGDTMSKPFLNGNISSPNVTVVDETKIKQAKQMEDVLSGKRYITELAENATEISEVLVRDMTEDRRPRSKSALEPRLMNTDSELLKMLAESSATFIATMNNDAITISGRIEAMSKRDSVQEAQPEELGTSEPSSTHSDDSKQKTSMESLVKNNKDADKHSDGFDNPGSRL